MNSLIGTIFTHESKLYKVYKAEYTSTIKYVEVFAERWSLEGEPCDQPSKNIYSTFHSSTHFFHSPRHFLTTLNWLPLELYGQMMTEAIYEV